MLNKELLLASQEVDPKYIMENSYFEVAPSTVTRAGGNQNMTLSFYTPFGLVLDNYPVDLRGDDNLYIPSEQFNKIPFDLSEMVGYAYSRFNTIYAEDVIIRIRGVNSGIVPYNDVWISFYPGALYVDVGTYTYAY